MNVHETGGTDPGVTHRFLEHFSLCVYLILRALATGGHRFGHEGREGRDQVLRVLDLRAKAGVAEWRGEMSRRGCGRVAKGADEGSNG